MATEKVRVYGKIEDFRGNPLEGADVMVMDADFEPKYKALTDEKGEYEMFVESGEYSSLFACKGYGVDNLEYWVWNLPAFEDMEISAKIDGLELYGMNAFTVQGASPNRIMVYVRPMSLKKTLPLMESGEIDKVEICEIAPEILKESIQVTVNEKDVEVYAINRVLENDGENKSNVAYLIHIEIPEEANKYQYNKITMTIHDSETDERGQGTIYWKEENRI